MKTIFNNRKQKFKQKKNDQDFKFLKIFPVFSKLFFAVILAHIKHENKIIIFSLFSSMFPLQILPCFFQTFFVSPFGPLNMETQCFPFFLLFTFSVFFAKSFPRQIMFPCSKGKLSGQLWLLAGIVVPKRARF